MNREIIAISGKSGCGNSTVSRLVADRLHYTLVNYTLRNMAEDMGVPFKRLLEMAETDFTHDRALDAKQRELALRGNCVLGSRLAAWIMKDVAYTVYLNASPATRYARIFAREGGSLDEITSFNSGRDKSDRERYLKIYGIDNDDFGFVNLVVDTENKTPSEIADEIVAGYLADQRNK